MKSSSKQVRTDVSELTEQLQRQVEWKVDEREPRVVGQGEQQRRMHRRAQYFHLKSLMNLRDYHQIFNLIYLDPR